MTKKDLFRIIIKLFGLYSLISFVTLYLSQIVLINSLFGSGQGITFVEIIWLVALLIIMLAFIGILIFRPDAIIKLFKLGKGLDDDELKISTINLENLIYFAIILTGGFLIAQSISPVIIGIGDIVVQFRDQGGVADFKIRDNYFYANVLNLVIGYLLITNFRSVTKFIFSKNKKKDNN